MKLDERVIDIFPDKAPAEPSENLKLLTVRDVLCMGCGMETMPRNDSEDWIREFLETPVVHKPGTAFMYNSMGSTLLGAMVRAKSALGLIDYLKPRLFDKIGICAEALKCSKMRDGMEIGGGGLYAATEDNLRLLKLYLDGGVWDGERILSEEYVRLATTLQNESATERAVNPPAEDNFVGYGFQIWMCRPEGVYRADGAMGQFTIVFPKYKMVLAITENASGGTGSEIPQRVLDTIWAWYDSLPAPDQGPLPEDIEAALHLKRRMSMLSLPAPKRSYVSPLQKEVEGEYRLKEGRLQVKLPDFLSPSGDEDDVETLKLSFTLNSAVFTIKEKSAAVRILEAYMDGSRKENTTAGLASRALASAEWLTDDMLRVTLRMVETCNEVILDFTFSEGKMLTESGSNHAFLRDRRDKAVFERV